MTCPKHLPREILFETVITSVFDALSINLLQLYQSKTKASEYSILFMDRFGPFPLVMMRQSLANREQFSEIIDKNTINLHGLRPV